jgi:hypothetical protein
MPRFIAHALRTPSEASLIVPLAYLLFIESMTAIKASPLASPSTNPNISACLPPAGTSSVNITPHFSSKPGKPSKHYKVSRNLAAHLSMLANTDEGRDTRCYFLDMERLAVKLVEYNYSRVHAPIKLDNEMTHAAYKRKPERATDHERMMKSYVCKVVTGLLASEVQLKYGMGIRDVLRNHPEQLDIYCKALAVAIEMYKANKEWKSFTEPLLMQLYGGKIDLEKLPAPQQ